MRRLTLVGFLALALTGGLTACSGDATEEPTAETSSAEATETEAEVIEEPSAEPTESASPEATETAPAIPASTNLDALTVTGDQGAKPTVTVPAPWAINRSQNKVLEAGDGPLVLPDSIVRLNYLGVNGRTGEVFDNSYDTGAPAAFSLSGVVAGFAKGLTGQNVGSRVLMAMPSDDGYGESGSGDKIQAGDSLIFVAEILAVSRTGISGEAAASPDGLPQVSGDLEPLVTLPNNPQQPAEVQVATIITGDGPAVTEGGQLQVNYVEYAWNGDNLKFIRQTYGTGAGAIYSSLSSAVPAWSALAGATEGSRVLIVSPPAQAYPNGDAEIGVAAGDYSVWVVDVLFAG
ncbi:MAG: FKBP-type peptidyl-prolyl cis-trans isomerase [Propionibacteriaceae bacterium]|jgi:peptidylprolyl isomerase|nr:FKBP-type peptidyl-prolyl cis-trans isomerase [Propionibacteriaceae bacterium]